MHFWLEQMRQELTEGGSAEKKMGELRISQRIHLGVKTRLELEIPYKKVWPGAMALGAQPQNVPQTLKQIHAISDEVWFQAGDKAIDVSKRPFLSVRRGERLECEPVPILTFDMFCLV